MILKIIRLSIISSLVVILLLNFVLCAQNDTNDDYVYDYGSGAEEINNRTDAPIDSTLSEVKVSVSSDQEDNSTKSDIDIENTTIDNNITTTEKSRVDSESPDSTESPSGTESSESTGSPESAESPESTESPESPESTESPESPESTESPESPDSTESSSGTKSPESTESDHEIETTGDEDNDSGEDGEQGSDSCDDEKLLDKLRNIHEEGKNLTLTKHVKHINETFDRLNHVRNLYRDLFKPDRSTMLELLGFVSSLDVILSPECFASFFAIITGVRNDELWAIKFMDSMGRFLESGFADGKHSSFGEYDECLEISSPDVEKGLVVKGQYCMIKLIAPYPKVNSYKKGDPYDQTWDENIRYIKNLNGQNLTTLTKLIEGLNMHNGSVFRMGLCVPALCKRHEVENFLNQLFYPITRLPLEVGPKCDIQDKSEDFTIFQLISMSILIVLTVVVLTSTGIEIYDIIYDKSIIKDNNNLGDVSFEGEELTNASPYYYAFSLVTNTRALWREDKTFAALDTIKLFLTLHFYVFHFYNTLATMGIVTLKRSFATYPGLVLYLDRYSTLRNSLLIDVLFTLSGFMLAQGLLTKLQRTGGKFNYPIYVADRWVRFSVLLLGSIIFFYLLPLLASGPIWDHGVNWVMRGCESPLVILSEFLFVANFNELFGIMPRQEAVPYCNPSVWFVSALFQLHVIVPILIIIYYKNPKRGLQLTIGAIVIGLFLTVVPTIFGILPHVQYMKIESFEELIKSFTWYHLSTTIYIASFLIGVIGGYLLKQDLKLIIEHEIILWVLTVLSVILVFMWNNTLWKLDETAPIHSVLLWYTFGRLAFAAAFTWIFYALCTGRAHILNYLLSWPNFRPFARLSFAFFMVHFIVIIRRVFSVKETILMTDGLMIENSIIDIMLTFILAYLFYILIECPFSNLMTLWSKPKYVTEEPHKNGTLTNTNNSEKSPDLGHSNEIELEEGIGMDKKVRINISEEQTIRI